MYLAKSTRLIVAVIFVLFLLQVVVSARLSTVGQDIAQMEERYQLLKQENAVLQQKIASNSSLLYIQTQAKKLGLNRPVKVLFIDPGLYVVQK